MHLIANSNILCNYWWIIDITWLVPCFHKRQFWRFWMTSVAPLCLFLRKTWCKGSIDFNASRWASWTIVYKIINTIFVKNKGIIIHSNSYIFLVLNWEISTFLSWWMEFSGILLPVSDNATLPNTFPHFFERALFSKITIFDLFVGWK